MSLSQFPEALGRVSSSPNSCHYLLESCRGFWLDKEKFPQSRHAEDFSPFWQLLPIEKKNSFQWPDFNFSFGCSTKTLKNPKTSAICSNSQHERRGPEIMEGGKNYSIEQKFEQQDWMKVWKVIYSVNSWKKCYQWLRLIITLGITRRKAFKFATLLLHASAQKKIRLFLIWSIFWLK